MAKKKPEDNARYHQGDVVKDKAGRIFTVKGRGDFSGQGAVIACEEDELTMLVPAPHTIVWGGDAERGKPRIPLSIIWGS